VEEMWGIVIGEGRIRFNLIRECFADGVDFRRGEDGGGLGSLRLRRSALQ